MHCVLHYTCYTCIVGTLLVPQKNLLVAAAAQVAEAPALEMEATTASMPVGAAALPEAEGGTISVADGRRWPAMATVENG